MRSLTLTWVFVLTSLLAGCATDRSYRAVLLDQENPDRYDVIEDGTGRYISGNPIFIGKDTQFSIRMNAVSPGWISQRFAPSSALKREDSASTDSTSAMRDHFKSKELWILTRIKSVSPADILETRSKQYFKASNVKFQTEAFALIPLDEAERVVFSHLSDSAYRITIEVFEIDSFRLKQEIAMAGQNPGVSQVLLDAAGTVTNILGAAVGDHVVSRLKSLADQPFAMERMLLEIGATREFSGEILVQRDTRAFSELYPGESFMSQNYFLVDWIKSGGATPPDGLTLLSEVNHRREILEFRKACLVTGADADACKGLANESLSFVEIQVDESPQDLDVKPEQLTREGLEDKRIELAAEVLPMRDRIRELLFTAAGAPEANSAVNSNADSAAAASSTGSTAFVALTPRIAPDVVGVDAQGAWQGIESLNQAESNLGDHADAMLALSDHIDSISRLMRGTANNQIFEVQSVLAAGRQKLQEYRQIDQLASSDNLSSLRAHLLRPLD